MNQKDILDLAVMHIGLLSSTLNKVSTQTSKTELETYKNAANTYENAFKLYILENDEPKLENYLARLRDLSQNTVEIKKLWNQARRDIDTIEKYLSKVAGSLSSNEQQIYDNLKNKFSKLNQYFDDNLIMETFSKIQELKLKFEALDYIEHNKPKVVIPVNRQEIENGMTNFKLELKTLEQLSSIVYPTRVGRFYLDNDVINQQCASDFCTYLLHHLHKDKKHIRAHIDHYFFENDVYFLAQTLLKDYINDEKSIILLENNKLLNKEELRNKFDYAKHLIFQKDTTKTEKVNIYCNLQHIIEHYNRCVKGLSNKCTFVGYKLNQTQIEYFNKLKKKNDATYNEVLNFAKEYCGKHFQDQSIKTYITTKNLLDENLQDELTKEKSL